MKHVPRRRTSPHGAALACVLLVVIPCGLIPALAAPPHPSGRWIWDDGAAAVEFHPCGNAVCARVVWLRDESPAGSRPVLDTHNADASLRGRRVCGLDYITDLRPTPDGSWAGGRIYDFLHGAGYDLDLTIVKTDHIDMRAYQGLRLFGVTLHLLPAPADLQPCSASHSATGPEAAP